MSKQVKPNLTEGLDDLPPVSPKAKKGNAENNDLIPASTSIVPGKKTRKSTKKDGENASYYLPKRTIELIKRIAYWDRLGGTGKAVTKAIDEFAKGKIYDPIPKE